MPIRTLVPRLVSFLSVLAVLAPCAAPAQAQSASDFADWTSVSGSPATASGTLHGSSISLSGSGVLAGGSTTDGSATVFNRSDVTPPLTTSDAVNFNGATGNSYTLTFGSPVTDPVLHLGSLGSTLHFPGGTQITRVSGDPQLSVSGSDVTGQIEAPTDDANGTVRLSGTFSSIAFTSTSSASTDGVYLQVGAASPPPPPPPSGGGGGSTAPPAPFIKALHRVNPPGALSSSGTALVQADVQGPATRLAWHVNGSARPVITSDARQNILQLRPGTKGAYVTVYPVGPGGLKGDRLSLQVPGLKPAAASPVAKKIEGRVLTQPVFRTGSVVQDSADRITCLARQLGRGDRVSGENGLLDIEGSLKQVQSLEDIPKSEQGIVVDMARRYGIALNERNADLGLSLSDVFISRCEVKVNGVSITPSGGAAVVIFPQIHAIASSNAAMSIAGPGGTGLKLDNPRRFVLDTLPRGGAIPFGSFPAIPGRDLVRGFAALGNVDVKAVAGGAEITAVLRAPAWLRFAAGDAHLTTTMRATTDDGLVLDSMHAHADQLFVGPLQIKDFDIRYARGGDTWTGQGEVCIPSGPCIGMTPKTAGGVRIAHGELEFIGASLPFRPPVTLFPGLDMDRIGFGFGLDPTRLLASTELRALRLVKIDGRLVVAFPSAAAPYALAQDREYLDPDPRNQRIPSHLYPVQRPNFTAAITGGASLDVPVVGEVPFGSAYLVYEYPGYVAFGGGIHQDLLGVAQVNGGLSGELNFANGRFSVFGGVDTCIGDCPDGLFSSHYGGDVYFSSVGMSVCVRPPILPDFGLGIRWPGRFPQDWNPQLGGCRWSTYKVVNVRGARARAAQAAALPYTFTMKAGDPARNIRLAGDGGSPRVRVTGPGGTVLDSSEHDGPVAKDKLMIIRFDRAKLTGVGVKAGAPGTYRVEALPGSPAVTQVATADALPAARIRASVDGHGPRRTLSYDIARRPGQKVTFVELTAGGAGRTAGTVAGGGRGSLRFSPAPGTGRRTIVAEFELAGVPAERITVARFSPPSPRLGRVRRLRVRRAGGRIRASWAPVAEATAYEVGVTTTGSEQRRRRVRSTSLRLVIPRSSAGRVTVRAVGFLRQGAPASAAFRRLSRPPNRLRKLARPPRLA